MDLAQLANLGEFVGGIAVLVTLVYLAVQIRHTKRAAQQTAYNSDARILQNIGLALINDAGLAKIASVGIREPEALSEAEALQFSNLVSELLYGYEAVRRSFERGLIDTDQWENVVDNSLETLTAPKVLEIARRRPSALAKRVVASIEERRDHFAQSG